MKIVSFDPASFRNLGWAICEYKKTADGILLGCAAGTFVIENNGDPWESLFPLQSLVRLFLDNNKPDLVVIEKTSSFHGGFITGQVSNCIGVILSSCGEINVDVKFTYPTHVKKVVTGKGKTTKAIIRKKVNEYLVKWGSNAIKFDSEHAADALANIVCWLLEDSSSPLRESQKDEQ